MHIGRKTWSVQYHIICKCIEQPRHDCDIVLSIQADIIEQGGQECKTVIRTDKGQKRTTDEKREKKNFSNKMR